MKDSGTMRAVPRPLPLSDDPRPPSRSRVSDGASRATRRGLRTQGVTGQNSTSAQVSRWSGLRARPALALLVAGVLAGGGAGALWSSSAAPQPVGTVSSAGTSGPVVARDADRASRGDARASLGAEPPAPVASGGSEDGAAVPDLPPGVDEVDFAAGVLSADVPVAASGELLTVPGSSPAPGTGEISTVRIQVEAGLDVDGTKVADLVLDTLNDPRSWGGDGSRTFARTDAADATFSVTLASPSTVDTLCAPLDTGGLWSCGVTDHAVLNYLRWVEGSPNYGDDMAAYRQYLVNHEVGHVLGHRHEQCGATDSLAPVMVQQSGALIRCEPNGWPTP